MPSHIIPPKRYVIVYVALLMLLVLTVALDKLPLGPWHLTAALTIAVVKGVGIALYFMHVRYSPPAVRVVSAAGLLWLLLLIGLTMADVVSRRTAGAAGAAVAPDRMPSAMPVGVACPRSRGHGTRPLA